MEELEGQASAPIPESTQDELTASPLSNSNIMSPDFRPVTNMRDHIRRFYKVYHKGITAESLGLANGLATYDIADLVGQRAQLVASPVSDAFATTLDLTSKMFLGCSGGTRFKVVVSGTSSASAWYVPPGFLAAQTTNGDAIYLSSIPSSRSITPNAVVLNSLMYQNLVDSATFVDNSFSAQCPTLERANYSVAAGIFSAYNSSGGDVNYVPDATSIIEFEVPNMSPYKFYGDVTKVFKIIIILSSCFKHLRNGPYCYIYTSHSDHRRR